jgi:hypothetical protein
VIKLASTARMERISLENINFATAGATTASGFPHAGAPPTAVIGDRPSPTRVGEPNPCEKQINRPRSGGPCGRRLVNRLQARFASIRPALLKICWMRAWH